MTQSNKSVISSIQQLPDNQHFLITGGTGFIGSQLVQVLAENGHHITLLTRNPSVQQSITHKTHLKNIHIIEQLDTIPFSEKIDTIINLAGEPIANGLWTQKKREKILNSRLKTTQSLLNLIQYLSTKPKLLINASAIGWYGLNEEAKLTEESSFQPCFSHDICQSWENLAMQAQEYQLRVACVRIGLVLGANGGFLSRLLPAFRWGLGGPLGHGQQWMSWIEKNDLIRLMIHIMLTPSLEGAINGTAPHPVNNNEFTQTLAKVLRRPGFFRIPSWFLNLVAGDLAKELLLGGQRVIPQKALDSDFVFQFEELQDALNSILKY